MSENYDVPLKIVQIYGRLERVYGSLIDDPDLTGFFDLKRLNEILRDINKYKELTFSTPYMKKDMISDERLNLLEQKCSKFLETNQEIIDTSQKD